ncbi:translesion error-prone DNA polymerase V autoproteolytic subunit [Algoriphagus jejuensis]|uniref:Translesion error-prone DNA polymerase V autoproteolytic subunit n=1 Tax=Algoriphagus jejuensis TaxID=419934 RepID=A0ABN1MZM5_9BACT
MELHPNPEQTLELFCATVGPALEIPYFSNGISAGFPSPALDFEDLKIDLNKHLIRNPSATFFGRVKGHSLKNAGIENGDLMVIDRSAPPVNNKIAVVFLDGEFTAKRIKKSGAELWLMPENEAYPPIQVKPDNQFLVWGIVTYVIKSF